MQGEPGVDYDEPNLNPLICDVCQQKFDSLDKLDEHQKQAHDMSPSPISVSEFARLTQITITYCLQVFFTCDTISTLTFVSSGQELSAGFDF
jgi:hypothetical protein